MFEFRGFSYLDHEKISKSCISTTGFEPMITLLVKAHLIERGYPVNLVQQTLSEVHFEDRTLDLQQKQNEQKRILPFVTTYHPSVPNLKQILMGKWHDTATAIAQRNIQRTAPHILQKRTFT